MDRLTRIAHRQKPDRLLQPGNVVRFPRGRTQHINLRVIERHESLEQEGGWIYIKGQQISRDSHALRASGFTVARKPRVYSLRPADFDRVTPVTDPVILEHAAKVTARETL